ncbi:MAG: Rid family hydrolase, partial [Bdellovibrionia bacterium]
MHKQIVETMSAPRPVGPYSQAVMAGDFLFCSGQIAINPETNE